MSSLVMLDAGGGTVQFSPKSRASSYVYALSLRSYFERCFCSTCPAVLQQSRCCCVPQFPPRPPPPPPSDCRPVTAAARPAPRLTGIESAPLRSRHV